MEAQGVSRRVIEFVRDKYNKYACVSAAWFLSIAMRWQRIQDSFCWLVFNVGAAFKTKESFTGPPAHPSCLQSISFSIKLVRNRPRWNCCTVT